MTTIPPEEVNSLSPEQLIFQTHQKLLSLLRHEGKSMKETTEQFQKLHSIPHYRYYQNLQFSEDDVRNIASMYSDGQFNLTALEYLLNQKVIRNASAVEKEKGDFQSQLNEIQKIVKKQQKIYPETRFGASDTFQSFSESQVKLTNEEKEYELWSGNYELPKKWKHFLAHAQSRKNLSGSSIFIPFKPPYWEAITRAEKDFTHSSTDSVPLSNPTKRSGTIDLFSRAQIENFFFTIPWFNGLTTSQFNQLQKAMKISDFKDGEFIVKKDERLPFTLIKKGKVGLFRGKQDQFGKPTNSEWERVQVISTAGVYGFRLDYHADQTKNQSAEIAEFNYRAIGDVTILTWPMESIKAILYSKDASSTGMDIIDQYSTIGLLFENYQFSPRQGEDFTRFAHLETLQELQAFFLKQREALSLYALSAEGGGVSVASGSGRANSPSRKRINVPSGPKPHEFLVEDILKLLAICVPELDFKDMIDEFIIAVKQIFQVDRLGLYSLDRDNNLMYLFTSEISTNSNNSAKTNPAPSTTGTLPRRDSDVTMSTTTGPATTTKPKLVSTIRMPLKGAAAHVAKHNQILNIEDCYKSEFFDSAMDVKAGYRTQQMLCIPIHNQQTQQVIGVLQLINPNPSRIFAKEDEEIGTIIAKLIAPYLFDLQKKALNFHLYRPIYHMEGFLQFSLQKVFTKLTNRHMKFLIRIVLGGKNQVPIKTSTSLLTVNMATKSTTTASGGGGGGGSVRNSYEPIDEDQEEQSEVDHDPLTAETIPLNYCPINQLIEFTHLPITTLTPSSFMIIEFFSKNNHPTGWSALPLFQYNRYFTATHRLLQIPLIAGSCPEDWLLVMERYNLCQRYFQENLSLVTSNTSNRDHLYTYPELMEKIQQFVIGYIELEIMNQLSTYYEDEQRIPFHTFSQIPTTTTTTATGGGGGGSVTSRHYHHQKRQFTTITEWIQSYPNLAEAKRKKFTQQIQGLLFYYLTTTKSSPSILTGGASNNNSNSNQPTLATVFDQDTKEFLWNHRDAFLDFFPTYISIFFLIVFDYTQRTHVKWLLIKLSSTTFTSSLPTTTGALTTNDFTFQATVPTILTLLDSRIAFGKLRSYATSALYFITTTTNIHHIHSILTLLLQILKGEIYHDSSLLRYLYEIAALFPEQIGINLYWLLQKMSINCPLLEGYRLIYLKEVLSILPESYRILLTNGWQLIQYLTLMDWNDPQYKESVNINLNDIFQDYTIKDFYFPFLPIEWIDRMVSNTSTNSPPPSNHPSSSGGRGAALPYFTELITMVPSHITLPGPGRTNIIPRYLLSCKTSNQKFEDYHFYPNFPMTKSESLLGYLIQLFNFLFHHYGEFPPLFQCYAQDFYFSGLEDTVIGRDLKSRYISVSQLIAESIRSKGKNIAIPAASSKKVAGGNAVGNAKNDASNENNNSNNNTITKIPDDLVSNYIRETHGVKMDSYELQDIQNRFLYSLASYLISIYVLQIDGVTAVNAFISEDGQLFYRYPTHFLGIASYDMSNFSTNNNGNTNSKKTGNNIFFLPSFVEMIGGRNSPEYSTLQNVLSKAYLALRREAGFLFFSIKTYLTAQQFPDDQSDQVAVTAMFEVFHRALNADYQLKVKS